MNELLARRYRLLFLNYKAGDTGAAFPFKRHITEWNTENGGRLRWDAALFLLTNLDRLIIQPYSGDISTGEGQILPLPNQLPADEWLARARFATDLILGSLAQSKGEISAHDVLQAIDRNWGKLSSAFGWG